MSLLPPVVAVLDEKFNLGIPGSYDEWYKITTDVLNEPNGYVVWHYPEDKGMGKPYNTFTLLPGMVMRLGMGTLHREVVFRRGFPLGKVVTLEEEETLWNS